MRNFYSKFTFIVATIILISCQIGWAQIPTSVNVPVTDPFDYSVGNLETVASDIWGRDGSTNVISVTTGSLTYTGFQSSGNKISLSGSTDHYIRNTKQNKTNRTDFYSSFLFRVTALPAASAPATGDYFMCFGNSGGRGSNFALLYLRRSTDGNHFNLGILKRGSSPLNDVSKIVWSTDDLSPNVTYHLVLGAALGTADDKTDDIANLWVNPSDNVNKPTPTLTASDGADLNNFYAMVWVILENGGLNTGLTMDIDELHISEGTTDHDGWSELVTLPVSFDKFSAEAQNNRTKLTWSTFSEQNNSGFEVERSLDGVDFAPLTTVSGKGSTSEQSFYTIYDNNPANGVNYYRLTQVDLNGKKTVLSVASATFKLDDAVSVSIYPNPVSSEINLLLKNYKGGFNAVLSTLDGRVIHQQKMEANAGQSVYVLSLSSKPAPGAYVLKVTGGKGLAKSVKIFVR